MTTGTLIIISAPSGAGKTTLVKALTAEQPWLTVSVSHTTRPPRPGDVDGIDYHFVSKAHFQELIEAGEMLEYAEIFGNWYGTSKGAIEACLQADQGVILEIDWQGAQQVRRLFSQAVSVFILPPSRQALLQRLQARGLDSESIIAQRFAEARQEMQHHSEYDYLLINDDFTQALAELRAIAVASRLHTERQRQRHQSLLSALLAVA